MTEASNRPEFPVPLPELDGNAVPVAAADHAAEAMQLMIRSILHVLRSQLGAGLVANQRIEFISGGGKRDVWKVVVLVEVLGGGWHLASTAAVEAFDKMLQTPEMWKVTNRDTHHVACVAQVPLLRLGWVAELLVGCPELDPPPP